MSLQINIDKMVAFMVGLLNTPSPTGDTDRAVAYVQEAFAPFPFTMKMSPKGFLTGTWAGELQTQPRALTAHVDTLGAMVREIKDNGRLRMTQLGGWMWTSVEGEGVTIFASNGRTYRGTILPTTASIHAHTAKERNEPRDDSNMEVRIDARTASREETAALGIRVGDIIAFDPRVEETDTGFIRSRHLDDKASVATIYGALDALHSTGLRPKQDTLIHVSNYEEVGHGAAAGFPANLHDLLTVDMAVVAPKQTSDEYGVTICAKDSGGPYHLNLRRELENLAAAHNIPYNTDIYPYYGSDGESYWRAGGNVRVGLIGPGVDASHHYERTHRNSLKHTAQLIAAYLLS
ncbi:MAG: M42 family metallopeptidase [Ardenticatenaceae bacterium]|nr:M42 family metallopeptidase [Anaerolineales bacterium]MCB8923518.1 M42 family metallopeptidase [Ardenticatenaceae bacterium]MCB8991911.1 M42 family metallopeptidase [Ardenticatenaceae bacterium]MCB9003757.1 M42 family metallopeptidase [Ardenticatenaceae bacterium]